MRRPIVAGNWKMHKAAGEAAELAAEIKRGAAGLDAVDVVLAPPFTALKAVGDLLRFGKVKLGAQNLHWESQGAFTGEISPGMLTDLGCQFVIVGHSERRTLFGETDETVARKTVAALEAGLTPIVCVGETLQQRESDETEAVLREQLSGGLGALGSRIGEIVLAYEPVWAIGTGKTATTQQAQDAHAFIRDVVGELAGEEVAAGLRIQYGGSVKPSNAAELFGQLDVDGGLIGGAALQAESFLAIAAAAAPRPVD